MKTFRVLVSLVAMAGSGLALSAAELTVFAAASVSDALNEIAPLYAKARGHIVRFNYGASGTLARQITEGAPVDVFLSADDQRMNQLADAGLLLTDTRRVLLANQLVVVISSDFAGSIVNLSDLAQSGIRRLAVGEPATVPAGSYAKQHLEAVGLWRQLLDKVVPLQNVRTVLAAVEAGNADAGIVYKTDALISKKVRIAVEVPLAEGPKIIYPVSVLKDSHNPGPARELVAFLAGVEAQAVFARFGFLPPPP